MPNRHLRATATAQILELMPGYLPGLATRHYARGLCSQHHSEADGTMRKTRCCSLSSESSIPLNISHSHPLSSLALLATDLLPLISSWVSPPASHQPGPPLHHRRSCPFLCPLRIAAPPRVECRQNLRRSSLSSIQRPRQSHWRRIQPFWI